MYSSEVHMDHSLRQIKCQTTKQVINIMSSVSPDHNCVELETSYNKKTGKLIAMEINNMLLSKQKVIKEIKVEIKMYLK